MQEDDVNLSRAYESFRIKAEDWYIRTRYELGESRIALDVSVLKPICEDCNSLFGRDSIGASGYVDAEIVPLLPETVVPDRQWFYDRTSRCICFFTSADDSSIDWPGITCTDCRSKIDAEAEYGLVSVYEESFIDYFRVYSEEEIATPKRLRGTNKKRMQEKIAALYGAYCFECEEPLNDNNFSLDHVIAKFRNGPSVAMNLQPLCIECNRKKDSAPIATVRLALDLLLRPAPSDSYEDPVW